MLEAQQTDVQPTTVSNMCTAIAGYRNRDHGASRGWLCEHTQTMKEKPTAVVKLKLKLRNSLLQSTNYEKNSKAS